MSLRIFKVTAYLEVDNSNLSGDGAKDINDLTEFVIDGLSCDPAIKPGMVVVEPCEGAGGTCTVLLDGLPVRSCLLLIAEAEEG